MQIEALSVELRPRSMAEAADLGAALVRQHAASVWRTFTPVYALVVLLAMACSEIAPWLPALIIFWLKPWLDRSLLFVLSRAVFGQATRWDDLWAARSSVWWGQFPATLLWRRLSPWRAFTQPIYQLEGQRGKAGRNRRALMLKAKRGAATAMHTAFAHVEAALYLGALSLLLWFAPEGSRAHVLSWLTGSESLGNVLISTLLYAAAVLVVEPFYVAAGLAMYLNRRVELEAWDIEQEFRHAFR
jgi:fatty acid desaturase